MENGMDYQAITENEMSSAETSVAGFSKNLKKTYYVNYMGSAQKIKLGLGLYTTSSSTPIFIAYTYYDFKNKLMILRKFVNLEIA